MIFLVVCEFPDVFLDELPSLLLDRDVAFKIELVLGTTPISKRPYYSRTAQNSKLLEALVFH